MATKNKRHLDSPSIHKWGTNEYGFPTTTINEDFKDITKNTVAALSPEKPPVAAPYRGTPVKDKSTHSSYIGGTKEEARQAYWEEAPIMKAATDSIAGRYGLTGELLRNRLDAEGFTDSAIALYNGVNTHVDAGNRDTVRSNILGYNYLHGVEEPNVGIQRFGLDDAATYIDSGFSNLINEDWESGDFTNEKGRDTKAANGLTILDNMGIMASLLKGFRDQAAKDYPNATSEELDNYANIYYNRGIEGGRSYINSGKGSVRYTKAYGGAIKPRRSLRSGGAIHIDPANRGKFNATKERTGKTTEELTHSKNPLTRKRAIFAQNAAKWNH